MTTYIPFESRPTNILPDITPALTSTQTVADAKTSPFQRYRGTRLPAKRDVETTPSRGGDENDGSPTEDGHYEAEYADQPRGTGHGATAKELRDQCTAP